VGFPECSLPGAACRLPSAIAARPEAAVEKACDRRGYMDFMAQRGFGRLWGDPAEFARFMVMGEVDTKAMVTTVGLLK
jgi:hypothetical protein